MDTLPVVLWLCPYITYSIFIYYPKDTILAIGIALCGKTSVASVEFLASVQEEATLSCVSVGEVGMLTGA